MEQRKPVGLVGVGAMGRALLKRLRMAGLEVQAFDVEEAARAAAHEGGAIVVDDAAETARGADFIHVIVPSDDDAMEAVAGSSGVLHGAQRGALILLHSTILPTTTRTLAEAAAAEGVDLIDAAVNAVPAKLGAGEGRFLVGGSEALVAKARDQLLLVGKSVHRFGPLGAGNVAKIAKSLINVSERVALNEVLQLATAGGLDLRQFLEFEREGPSERCTARWEQVFDIADNQARPRPASNLFRKDVFLALKLADVYGLDAPLARGSAETARHWLAIWDGISADRT